MNFIANRIFFYGGGGLFEFYGFKYFIQHCFICRPSDSTVSEDAGIEPRTVATLPLEVRHFIQSARFHLQMGQNSNHYWITKRDSAVWPIFRFFCIIQFGTGPLHNCYSLRDFSFKFSEILENRFPTSNDTGSR